MVMKTIPRSVYERIHPKLDMTKEYFRWRDYRVTYMGPVGADPDEMSRQFQALSLQGWKMDRVVGDFLIWERDEYYEIVEDSEVPREAPEVGDSTPPEGGSGGVAEPLEG